MTRLLLFMPLGLLFAGLVVWQTRKSRKRPMKQTTKTLLACA